MVTNPMETLVDFSLVNAMVAKVEKSNETKSFIDDRSYPFAFVGRTVKKSAKVYERDCRVFIHNRDFVVRLPRSLNKT